MRHSLYVHRIEGLAHLHEQAIALGPAEVDIGADLWQGDLAYRGAIGREDIYAGIAIAHSSYAGPDVAVILAHGKGMSIGGNFTEVLRTHNLHVLLRLSGVEEKIKTTSLAARRCCAHSHKFSMALLRLQPAVVYDTGCEVSARYVRSCIRSASPVQGAVEWGHNL